MVSVLGILVAWDTRRHSALRFLCPVAARMGLRIRVRPCQVYDTTQELQRTRQELADHEAEAAATAQEHGERGDVCPLHRCQLGTESWTP